MAVERIWFQDPMRFFSDDRLAHFIPEKNTPLAVQLNALMRLSIYASVVMILFRRYSLAVYLPLSVAALTYVMYVTLTPSSRVAAASREGLTREGKRCTVPTHYNPYMNILPYGADPDPPPACDVSSAVTMAEASSCFDDNLYRDVDDVFNRRASSHAFYTMPNTQNPSDQGAFARWCYGMPPTFKEGGIAYRASSDLQDAAGNRGSGDTSSP